MLQTDAAAASKEAFLHILSTGCFKNTTPMILSLLGSHFKKKSPVTLLTHCILKSLGHPIRTVWLALEWGKKQNTKEH